MGVYIKNMETPKSCAECLNIGWHYVFECCLDDVEDGGKLPSCPLIELPPHGRLIDADKLRKSMYHEAFETDSPMQKWDSGCWIRYKMFERAEESAPTIIPAEAEVLE